VGLALGTGTDIAVESGQIVLVSPDVKGVTRAIKLSREAARIIRWNLFLAFASNIVLIPWAFLDTLTPAVGASAMTVSSVLVILNALRLTYAHPDDGAKALPPAAPTSQTPQVSSAA
jgi:Cu+-exporting ATPase